MDPAAKGKRPRPEDSPLGAGGGGVVEGATAAVAKCSLEQSMVDAVVPQPSGTSPSKASSSAPPLRVAIAAAAAPEPASEAYVVAPPLASEAPAAPAAAPAASAATALEGGGGSSGSSNSSSSSSASNSCANAEASGSKASATAEEVGGGEAEGSRSGSAAVQAATFGSCAAPMVPGWGMADTTSWSWGAEPSAAANLWLAPASAGGLVAAERGREEEEEGEGEEAAATTAAAGDEEKDNEAHNAALLASAAAEGKEEGKIPVLLLPLAPYSTGEEAEVSLIQVRAKLFLAERVEGPAAAGAAAVRWKECGVGPLRCNIRKELAHLLPSAYLQIATAVDASGSTTLGTALQRAAMAGGAGAGAGAGGGGGLVEGGGSSSEQASAASGAAGGGSGDAAAAAPRTIPVARLIMRQEGHQCGPGTRLIMNAIVGSECQAALHAQDTKTITLSAFSTTPRHRDPPAGSASAEAPSSTSSSASSASSSSSASSGSPSQLSTAAPLVEPPAAEWAIRSFCIKLSKPEEASAVLEAIKQQKRLVLLERKEKG